MSNIPKRSDEAAFPRPTQYREPNQDNVLLPAQWGLTKRELFAAMALQGQLANESYVAAAVKVGDEDGIPAVVSIARAAIQHADALLAELAK